MNPFSLPSPGPGLRTAFCLSQSLNDLSVSEASASAGEEEEASASAHDEDDALLPSVTPTKRTAKVVSRSDSSDSEEESQTEAENADAALASLGMCQATSLGCGQPASLKKCQTTIAACQELSPDNFALKMLNICKRVARDARSNGPNLYASDSSTSPVKRKNGKDSAKSPVKRRPVNHLWKPIYRKRASKQLSQVQEFQGFQIMDEFSTPEKSVHQLDGIDGTDGL